MYRYFSFLILFILLPAANSIKSTAQSDKIALIVAISQYAPQSGWPRTNAHNDVLLLRYALQRQGFEEKNILILKDEEATRKGVLKAIEKHLLRKAKAGGTALFHFSGHGQQILDQNGDEIDGLDEALAPYDSPIAYEKGKYEGENLIRDEELGALLGTVRRKLGPSGQILVLLDACHSGTGVRGAATVRGTERIMKPEKAAAAKKRSDENNAVEADSANEKEVAPLIAFFSTGARQLNYEMRDENGRYYGPLSYAFSKAFAQAEPETTYRSLFRQIQLTMAVHAPRQRPQAEGDLERTLAGSPISGKTSYFLTDPERRLSPRKLSLKGGTLMGLFPGTKLRFYPADTYEPEEAVALAFGQVGKSGPIHAEVDLDRPLSKREALQSWVYVEEYHFSHLGVDVYMNLNNPSLMRALIEVQKRFPMIQFSEKREDSDLFIGADADQIVRLNTADGYVLAQLNANEPAASIVEELIKIILNYVQGKFLRGLEMSNPHLNTRMQIMTAKKERSESKVAQMRPYQAGRDTMTLKITNEGSLPAYYSILDIQPDNQFNVVIPDYKSGKKPEDYFIRPGETQLIRFRIYKPTGTEVLKLIGSREPLYLKKIISSRGRQKTSHPFEVLFAASYFYNNRGGGKLNLRPAVSIQSLAFEIR